MRRIRWISTGRRQGSTVGEEQVMAATPVGSESACQQQSGRRSARQFSTEAPKQSFHSNSDEFDFQVFEGFYRVLDARTGEPLQEQTGWSPNSWEAAHLPLSENAVVTRALCLPRSPSECCGSVILPNDSIAVQFHPSAIPFVRPVSLRVQKADLIAGNVPSA